MEELLVYKHVSSVGSDSSFVRLSTLQEACLQPHITPSANSATSVKNVKDSMSNNILQSKDTIAVLCFLLIPPPPHTHTQNAAKMTLSG